MDSVQMINNPTITSILNRRSIRAYKREALGTDVLATLMETALQAPTGRNMQSCDVIVVTDEKILKALDQGFAAYIQKNGSPMALPENYSVLYNAPAFAFIVGDPKNRWYHVDAGIIVENMAVAAESLGAGSCIIGMVKDYMNSAEGAELMQAIGAPEGYEFVIGLALGVPDEAPEAKPRDGSKVRFL
ncbi:MAG: nitroreductase family protein [Eubacterium sp.]|nr:nitroreductase family protein [Eubacterium sp.]